MVKKARKTKPVKRVTVAVLDERGVLNALVEVTEARANPGPRRIICADGCDLEPGKYRWDVGRGAFMPVVKAPSDDFNVMVRGIAAGFEAIRKSGVVELPRETLDWLAIWRRSGELGVSPGQHGRGDTPRVPPGELGG